MPALHLVITTHTTRHLRRALLGAACQERRADRVVVSTDNDQPEIAEVVGAGAAEFGMPITLVQRPFRGDSRSGQVRNNGVRALLRETGATSTPGGVRLVFLDGDCCPAPGTLAAHEDLGGQGALVIGFRVDLTSPQTEGFDEAAVARGGAPVAITDEQTRMLMERERRYRRHAWLRRLGLMSAHKPKLLSANFSIPLDVFVRINGFDEEYVGYGGEDDDLGRRVYRTGGKAVIGIAAAVVYHLWHPSRAAGDWAESPGIARFRMRTPDRAAFGLDRPFDQPEPTVRVLEPDGAPAGAIHAAAGTDTRYER